MTCMTGANNQWRYKYKYLLGNAPNERMCIEMILKLLLQIGVMKAMTVVQAMMTTTMMTIQNELTRPMKCLVSCEQT